MGLVGICFIALGALVACPSEDESKSSDASLNALTLSDGTTDVPLIPGFASDTLEYDATIIPSPQLAAITSLTVSGLSSLIADDFANLTALTTVDLSGNIGLTRLPSCGFTDLLNTLTTALPTAVQIPYAVTFANSADASDFSGLADGMVTFAAGSTAMQSISVTATATADVGGTATLTLGTPILTVDTRTSGRLDPASLVSVGSTTFHTLTVLEGPGATLSVTDDSVTEEATDGTPGREAKIKLALTNLPTSSADDIPFERLPEQDFTTLAAGNILNEHEFFGIKSY